MIPLIFSLGFWQTHWFWGPPTQPLLKWRSLFTEYLGKIREIFKDLLPPKDLVSRWWEKVHQIFIRGGSKFAKFDNFKWFYFHFFQNFLKIYSNLLEKISSQKFQFFNNFNGNFFIFEKNLKFSQFFPDRIWANI